jgi:hypothetical protein
MADAYIDQFETLGYGDFAVAQIASMVQGLDPPMDGALEVMRGRLADRTTAMRAQLTQAGLIQGATYASAAKNGDPVGEARALVRRAVSYAASRPDGETIVTQMLGDETLSTIGRRRATKLVPILERAAAACTACAASLPEHATWAAQLVSAAATITELNKEVRRVRAERRAMTPAVAQAREAWLATYLATKRLVEAVLMQADKQSLMPLVFDDLAEVQTVAGVVADAPPPAGAAPTPPVTG